MLFWAGRWGRSWAGGNRWRNFWKKSWHSLSRLSERDGRSA